MSTTGLQTAVWLIDFALDLNPDLKLDLDKLQNRDSRSAIAFLYEATLVA